MGCEKSPLFREFLKEGVEERCVQPRPCTAHIRQQSNCPRPDERKHPTACPTDVFVKCKFWLISQPRMQQDIIVPYVVFNFIIYSICFRSKQTISSGFLQVNTKTSRHKRSAKHGSSLVS